MQRSTCSIKAGSEGLTLYDENTKSIVGRKEYTICMEMLFSPPYRVVAWVVTNHALVCALGLPCIFPGHKGHPPLAKTRYEDAALSGYLPVKWMLCWVDWGRNCRSYSFSLVEDKGTWCICHSSLIN